MTACNGAIVISAVALICVGAAAQEAKPAPHAPPAPPRFTPESCPDVPPLGSNAPVVAPPPAPEMPSPPPPPQRERGERRPGQAGPRHGQWHKPMINPAELKNIQNWLKEKDPKKAAELDALRTADPDAFGGQMREVVKQYMKEKHPDVVARIRELREAEQRTRSLVEQVRKEQDPTKKDEIRAALREELRKEFERRQRARKEEVAKLETRLGDLKAKLEQRTETKDELIEARMADLIEGQETREW